MGVHISRQTFTTPTLTGDVPLTENPNSKRLECGRGDKIIGLCAVARMPAAVADLHQVDDRVTQHVEKAPGVTMNTAAWRDGSPIGSGTDRNAKRTC